MVPNSSEAASRWLRSRHIIVPNDWVEACIEWISEENQGQQQSQTQINSLVYEQWLLADLHELQSKCLPDAVVSSNKFQLTGTYALQIDSLVDVGQPFYSQLQKVKGTENPNVHVSGDQPEQKPWEPKPSRMLMMKLTDGTVNVQGMEYKTIVNLNAKLNPGTKILVQGSVLCRHGVLMLKGDNVQVLGGEVDTLMETNTQEKVLQEALDGSGQNAGKECKQEFDEEPVQRGQNRGQSVARVGQQGVRPQQYNHANSIPTNRRDQGSEVKNINGENQVKQEPEWEDDFAFDELMDDFEMNQPGPSTSNTNRNPMPSSRNNMSGTTNLQKKVVTGNQRNQPGIGRGRQLAHPVKQEVDDQMNVGNVCPSAASDSGRAQVRGNYKSDIPVKSEMDMENSFLANLKSGSFSSSTPLKPFETSAKINQKNSLFIKSSATCVADEKKAVTVSENMETDEFEDDLDDFDLVNSFEENSIPELNVNQNSNVTSPASNSSNTATSSKKLDCSKSVEDNSSGNIVCKLLGQSEAAVPDHSNLGGSLGVMATNSTTSPKVTTVTSPMVTAATSPKKIGTPKSALNTIDRYLTSPSKSGKKQNSVISPGCKRPASDDGILEKFNPVKTTDISSLGRVPVGISAEPFTYLSVVRKQLPTNNAFTFKVKAYVSTLNGKLECSKGDKWTLSCKINDGTDTMDVDLSNQVLTMLIGFSAKDSIEMRKRIKQDPGIRDVLAEGIQQCQQKLIELLCIMEIEVDVGQRRPEVISLIPVTNSHMLTLHDRVFSSLNKIV